MYMMDRVCRLLEEQMAAAEAKSLLVHMLAALLRGVMQAKGGGGEG